MSITIGPFAGSRPGLCFGCFIAIMIFPTFSIAENVQDEVVKDTVAHPDQVVAVEVLEKAADQEKQGDGQANDGDKDPLVFFGHFGSR